MNSNPMEERKDCIMDKEMENNVEAVKELPVYQPDVIVSEPATKKKKGKAGKIVALAICCFLAGGAAGAGGVLAYDAFRGPDRTRIEDFRRDGRFAGQFAGRFDGRDFDGNNSKGNSGSRQKTERRNRNSDSSAYGKRRQNGNGQNGSGQRSGRWQGRKNNGNNAQTPDNQAPADNGQAPDSTTPAPSGNSGASN